MSKNRKKKFFHKKRPQFPQRGPNAIWLLMIMLAVGIGYLLWYNSINRDIEVINYSTLMTKVKNNENKSVKVQDYYVQGSYQDGKTFSAYIVPTEKFWNILETHTVEIEVFPPV